MLDKALIMTLKCQYCLVLAIKVHGLSNACDWITLSFLSAEVIIANDDCCELSYLQMFHVNDVLQICPNTLYYTPPLLCDCCFCHKENFRRATRNPQS